MSRARKLLVFVIAHPYDLLFFYRLVNETNYSKIYNIKLIVIEQKYFKQKNNITKAILSKISNNIVFIKNSQIPRYSMNIFKHVFLAYKMKKVIRKEFQKSDVLLILDKSAFTSNLVINYFKSPILFQFLNKTNHISNYKINYKKNTLVACYHFLTLIPRVKVLKLQDSTHLIEEVDLKSPKIQRIMISNEPGSNTIRFSDVKQQGDPKKIVIFGSRYYQWGLSKSILERIRNYFELIYKEYHREYEFIYIKHPLERGEELEQIQKLFLNSIRVENNFLNSEHFLLENKDIAQCFSIGSTSSKSAYQMGYNSSVAYKWIFHDSVMLSAFDSIFSDMPNDIHWYGPKYKLGTERMLARKDSTLTALNDLIVERFRSA